MANYNSSIDNKINDLNNVDAFKIRHNGMPVFKRLIHKMIGWYVDSFGESIMNSNRKISNILNEMNIQSAALQKAVEQLIEENSQLSERSNEYKSHMEKIGADIEDSNRKFDELFSRCDEGDRRLDELFLKGDNFNAKFDELFLRCDEEDRRLDENNHRFDDNNKKLDELFLNGDNFNAKFDELFSRCDEEDRRLDENNLRMDSHDRSIDFLNSHLRDAFSDSFISYSQSGEDCIVIYLLRFLKLDISRIKYLDLGANHSKKLSNSYRLYQMGARGVLVEANPELIPELKRDRSEDIILNNVITDDDNEYQEFYVLTGDGLSTIDYESAKKVCEINPEVKLKCKYNIPTVRISTILDKFFSDRLDVLSVDLEGLELCVLKQIDFNRYRPRIIIFENIDCSTTLITEKKENHDITDILQKNHYIEYAFTGINSIYIDKDFVDMVNMGIASGKPLLLTSNMPYCSLKVEDIVYFHDPCDEVIPQSMISSGVNFAKGDIDNFIKISDEQFYKNCSPKEGIFLDIGGNIGTTSIYCKIKLKNKMRFIAFEPVEKIARLFEANCAINGVSSDIRLEQIGLSNRVNSTYMRIDRENLGNSEIISKEDALSMDEPLERIYTTTLDRYLSEHDVKKDSIKYIWIDTEGHEPEVLEGAAELYSKHRIPTWLEFNQSIYKEQDKYDLMLEILQKYFNCFFTNIQLSKQNYKPRPINDLVKLWDELDHDFCDLLLF